MCIPDGSVSGGIACTYALLLCWSSRKILLKFPDCSVTYLEIAAFLEFPENIVGVPICTSHVVF